MKKIFINYSVCVLALMAMLSCEVDETNNLFDEVPAIRTADEISELEVLLLSQEQGFTGYYFTKSDQFGGFNFHMKFNEDQTVEMTSDVDSQTAITTARYEVSLGTTTELVFTTNNSHIHKLVQDGAAGFDSRRGNSVFQYFSNDNGTIFFREVRSDGRFVLVPSGFTDFEAESIAAAKITLDNRLIFTNSPYVTAFPFMGIETNGNVTLFDLNYDSEDQYATPITQAEDGTVSEVEFGILFTENGLKINPPLVYEGVAFENFVQDPTTGQYISTVGGSSSTATIGYANAPSVPLNPYDFTVRRDNARYNFLEPEKTSATFRDLYDEATAQFIVDSGGFTIARVYYRNLSSEGIPFMDIYIPTSTGDFRAQYELDITVEDGIVKFALTGVTNNNAQFITDALQPLFDAFLGDARGYYLKKTGGLQDFSNRTFSMISVSDPRLEINFYDF